MIIPVKSLKKVSVLEFGEWSFLTDFGSPVLIAAGTEFFRIDKIFGLCYDIEIDPKKVILVAPAGSFLTKDSFGNLNFIKEKDFNLFQNNLSENFKNLLIPKSTSQELNNKLEETLNNSDLLGYNRKK